MTPEEREKMDLVQKEIKGLSERQQKIEEITRDIYTGKNR
jgi:hypothetical protein